MYSVGLTGGIASGKSTVLTYFQSFGIEVFSADKIAKSLTEINQPTLKKIKEHFGPLILDDKGQLSRHQLRQRIFSNPDDRLWLENLLHPLIRKTLEEQVHSCKTAYCVVEIPLLKSRVDYPYLDRVLVILSENSRQIERIMARDGTSHEDALKILRSQISDLERTSLADDLIVNNNDKENLFKEIKNLHNIYLHLASKKTS